MQHGGTRLCRFCAQIFSSVIFDVLLFPLCLFAFSRGYMGGPPQHQGPPVHMGQMAPGPPPDMRGPPMDMRGPHMGEPRNMMGDPRGPMMMEPRGPPMEARGRVTLRIRSGMPVVIAA